MYQVRTILRNATRKHGDPLNICTFPTHERYEGVFKLFPHSFWALSGPDVKKWNTQYGPIPPNYHITDNIPNYLDLDLILAQNVSAHMPIAINIAKQLRIPIINLWHVLPPPQIKRSVLEKNMKELDGICVNAFISECNKKAWGWGNTNAPVIKHCVDTDFWKPLGTERKNYALSVVNDWINRDWACGFNLWANVVALNTPHMLPCKALGNTPGLSQAANGPEDLRNEYNQASVFINTSLYSPIPTVVLEAMSCGCAVVSTNTCMLPEIIQHGYNGLLCDPNDVQQFRRHVEDLLDHPERARKLGDNARKTMVEQFPVKRFIDDWNDLFYKVLGENNEN